MTIRRIDKVGHRGAAGHAPENTIVGLERGIELGADFVEIDVQLTRDGHLVLMHDKSVDRTTNGTGTLCEMSLEELRQLDAGNGQLVPLLEEALRVVNARAGIVIECITPGIGAQVYREVREFEFKTPVIFSSFLHKEILGIRALDPKVMTMALLEAVPIVQTAFAQESRATHAGIALDSMTSEFRHALQNAGFKVFVYTVDTPQQINLARKLEVDGIISNFPDRL